MRKKIFGLIFILFLMVFCVPIFSGCKGCNSEREKFSIVFLIDDKEYVTITTAGKEQIILPLNPVKTDYVFDGWYFDKEFKNEVGSDSFVKKYLTKDVFVYSKWVAASGGAYTLTQISTNFTGQNLSQVLLDCDEHNDCSLQWQKPNSVLTTARANYFVNHTKDGATTTQAVEVEAVARLDSNYCFQDMLFTLNNSKGTASVKANSDSIVSVIIPEKVIYNETIYVVDQIEYRAFYDIDTLKYVYVPASIKIYNGSAFAHNKNLQTAELDKDLTVLGVQMFMYCSNLQNINIPQGVTTIPTGFLYSCSKITSITLPNGITKIDSTAFLGTSFTSINLPSGLLEIGANAFASTDLERVVIPASVSFIDDKAFSGASMLKEVVILSKNIEIGLEAFTSCRELRTVYINSAALVNSITTDTQDTHKLIYNMQNGDTLYISKDITLTSPYITSLFTKVDCSVVGYNAYKLGKYSKLSVQNFVNRVYVKGAGLYGDETIKILAPDNTWQTITLDKSMMEFFDTSTVGKKLAKSTYKFNVINCEYYAVKLCRIYRT